MFRLYRLIVALLFYGTLPFSLLLVSLTGKHRQGLRQRFAFYPDNLLEKNRSKTITVWLHAASVGEVQAVRAIISELIKTLGDIDIILTTMTLAGKRVAEQQLDISVACFLAPLDVPGIVERAISRFKPDLYICIETELWPVLLESLARRNVYLGMVNGRISEGSYGKYQKMGKIFAHILHKFNAMAVISERDRSRYISLGAKSERITVEGNVKFDIKVEQNKTEVVSKYKKLLRIENEEIFIAGSTHNNEEVLLVPLYRRLQKERRTLFIIAPRHIERISSIEKIFQSEKIEYQLLSELKSKNEIRQHSMLLIDTMGDLAHIYAVADFTFCGGSLVEKGGHNLMEAAVWDKVVFYGKHIDDFHDAAELLESVQGGFAVDTIAEMEEKMSHFRNHPQEYHAACLKAGEIARAQQGSSARQIKYVLQSFSDRSPS